MSTSRVTGKLTGIHNGGSVVGFEVQAGSHLHVFYGDGRMMWQAIEASGVQLGDTVRCEHEGPMLYAFDVAFAR